MDMQKVLVICGPTATGKTNLALKIAQQLNGELISADSRQVYKGMDIITGKDLPTNIKPQTSNLRWRGKSLEYYVIFGIKVWLYDVVNPDEPFNVAFWRECAGLVIANILARGKLPIVVGGTGLYIKSLLENLANIDVPVNEELRKSLMSTKELQVKLIKLDEQRYYSMNESDRQNPRRLVRAIEITRNRFPSLKVREGLGVSYVVIGLTAPKEILFENIDKRVLQRIENGARLEYEAMHQKYTDNLPSMSAPGYADWDHWAVREQQYAKRQLVWFKKMPAVDWFDAPKTDFGAIIGACRRKLKSPTGPSSSPRSS